jgi:hypothetical protein
MARTVRACPQAAAAKVESIQGPGGIAVPEGIGKHDIASIDLGPSARCKASGISSR